MAPTHIIKQLNTEEYKQLIKNIQISPHARFRIDEGQRKVYKDEYLIETLEKEQPELAGIQENGRYAAFFRRKEGYLRIIFTATPEKTEIVTFFITESIPKNGTS